ncbi:MAG: peptidase M28, partial [Thermoanaerobaculia bacterium]
WEAKNYHQPSDEYSPDWNFEGMIEDVLIGFHAGLAIAQDTKMPAWNPGDEFEAARKRALASVNAK